MPWHAKPRGRYYLTDQDGLDNTWMAWNLLGSLGWTETAFAGLWGNSGSEGQYNPWRWQGDNILSSDDPDIDAQPSKAHAYGLCQFDPAGKYIHDSRAQALSGYGPNFSDRTGNVNDGNAQLLFINSYADYYSTNAFPISYSAYKADTTHSISWMVEAWARNYERPRETDLINTLPYRISEAEKTLEIIGGTPPTPPEPPTPSSRKLPLFFYIRYPF